MIRRSTIAARLQQGVNLIELMVALAIGLFLLLALVQIFTAGRQSANSSMSLARVQENGRFALELLKPPLRMAGLNTFCAGNLVVRNHLNMTCDASVNFIFDPASSILGWEYDGTGPSDAFAYEEDDLDPDGADPALWTSVDAAGTELELPAFLENLVVPGSDVLLIRRAEPVPGITATGASGQGASTIALTLAHALAPASVLLVTDCATGADIFQNSSAAGLNLGRGVGDCAAPGPGNVDPAPNSWSTQYGDNMQIFSQRIEVYFVGLDAASGEPGLYRMNLGTGMTGVTIDPLVDGIENMQLRFGISFAGDDATNPGSGQAVDMWLGADQVNDWGLVVALRVSLLSRSADVADQLPVSDTYNLAGTLVTHSEDRRLRKPFTATIALRNRVIVL